jgi:hypothetical protein
MRRLVAAVVLSAACVTGCGDEDRGGTSVIPEASQDYALPGDTVEEWVEHGDQLSVISVTRESKPAVWPEYRNSGGLVGRNVTAEIERTLWRRDGAPRAGRRLRFDVWGWMYDDDQDPESPRYELVAEGATRIEPGHRYLAVLKRRRGEWGPLRDSAVMPLAPDGRVTSEVYAGRPSEGAAELRGHTLAEARALLRDAAAP